MAITKEDVIIQVESVGKYLIRVITNTEIKEDGKLLSKEQSKREIRPDADWSGEDPYIKKMCDALFIANIIKEYKDGTSKN